MYFFKDHKDNVCITWDMLINDLNSTSSYNPYCKEERYYNIFRNIVISMLLGKDITLFDYDFTKDEVDNFVGSNDKNCTQIIEIDKRVLLTDKYDVIKKLKNTSSDWKITLFTSGTTGTPKKITHNFVSITRFVKYSEKNSIWGFAYNPTHMAGVQVFLQALLNGNTIIRLFGLLPDEIKNEIAENDITHISATPTFYRLLLPCDEIFQSIERITSGGEKFDEHTSVRLATIFPKAKITNVYASTEAGTLFASSNDTFTIKKEYEHLIKIDNEELLIHKILMGESELKTTEWYNTGDLVEKVSDNPLRFRFMSRKSEMINVGGYKVNPIEVEEAILAFDGIRDAIVYAKSNSVLGNVICCDAVRENEQVKESTIRIYLQSKMQEFKIPRIINFVEKLSTTRTGKTKRNKS